MYLALAHIMTHKVHLLKLTPHCGKLGYDLYSQHNFIFYSTTAQCNFCLHMLRRPWYVRLVSEMYYKE